MNVQFARSRLGSHCVDTRADDNDECAKRRANGDKALSIAQTAL